MTITRWLTCLVLTAAAGSAAAQTLGDVARAEQERRKSVGKPGKVYTNESLKPEPLPAPPPLPPGGAPGAGTGAGVLAALAAGGTGSSTGAAAGSGSAAAGGAATPTAGGNTLPTTESGWRARMAELRGNVVRQQVLADALQSRINAALLDFVNRDDPAQRAVIESDRNRAIAELERVQKDMKAAQQAVADAEEQARRASVPPGWLR
ncbi:MAG: hypothetical protein AB7I25_02460 [Vicinamibacterales bacterium]